MHVREHGRCRGNLEARLPAAPSGQAPGLTTIVGAKNTTYLDSGIRALSMKGKAPDAPRLRGVRKEPAVFVAQSRHFQTLSPRLGTVVGDKDAGRLGPGKFEI